MLVIRRSQSVVAPGAYCFPGGGIEPGESEQEALVREFREEISLSIRPLRRIWTNVTPWKVELAWWRAAADPHDVPVANEAEVASIHWLTPSEMLAVPELLPSNQEFLELVLDGRIELGPG